MNESKKIKRLVTLTGPVLIFGGVYSNWQALDKLQSIAREQGIPSENVICTGDVVGYCAQPEEVVQAIKAWDIHCIAGNVEMQLRDGEEDCGCNFNDGSRCDLLSRQWYPYAQAQLSQASIDWMKTLPEFLQFQYAGKTVLVVHGSYFNTSEFVFRSMPWPVKQRNFAATGADVILAGHCGLPFHQQEGAHLWLNPGVIGMPANDGTPRVWYALLDDGAGFSFQHFAYKYDNLRAAQLMRRAKLPSSYAQTLETGLWDNCEILPEVETNATGMELELGGPVLKF